ncbi:MAG: aspartate aminotransferase family protein [Alphaproteobacteria bacterium]
MTAKPLRNIDIETALAEAERAYVAANPKSRAAWEAACHAMPGGNTRTVLFYPPFPLTLARGEGARVWDVDGHAYADFLGEYTAGLYGHSQPAVQAAVKRALDGGIVLGGHNEVEGRFAEAVCARFPSLDLVRFCNSGTEANLMALSAARAWTGRERIMAFEGAYHGGVFYYETGGSPLNAPFPMVIGHYNDAERTLALIEAHADDLAAIVVEPMMGAAGCIPGEPAFLGALREASARHGIVLIFDEVITSRLSPGGLQEVLGITPDMTTLGKYLGGGLTFGAFGGRAEIMQRFDPRAEDAFPHAGTFNNNVLTMAAGLAGITEAFTPEAAVALNAAGDRLRERLNGVTKARGAAAQVTGLGSMMCMHFRAGSIRAPEDAAARDQTAGAMFHIEMIARGHYLARRGMINLSLPMTDADFDGLVAALDGFLAEHGPVLADA